MSVTLLPLELASTDELIVELKRRHDAVLIATLQNRGDADYFFIDWKHLTTAIGLAERARGRLVQYALDPNTQASSSGEE